MSATGDKRGILALLGLRGAGKTTLGAALARELGVPFVDLDDELCKHAGRAERSAGALLRELGEPAFRELEVVALRAVLARAGPFVLATGGGVVERAENRAALAQAAQCVWLSAPNAVLAARIAASGVDRPRVAGTGSEDELAQLSARRAAHYRALGGEPVSTEGTPADALERLRRDLNGRGALTTLLSTIRRGVEQSGSSSGS